MKTLRLSLLLLLLAGSFWSCTDHRNSPAAPQRLRLKATDNSITQSGFFTNYQGRTEYIYDQTGRLASVFRPNVSRATFAYDAQDRVVSYDNKSATSQELHRILFKYSPIDYAPNFNGVLVESYASSTGAIINGQSAIEKGGLSFDDNKRITTL